MFMRDRFQGIRIEATGQNIITLGDGNQVNLRFRALGEALSDLRTAIKQADKIPDSEKIDLVVDVDTIQTQLARSAPDEQLVARLWERINRAASLAGLTEAAAKVAEFLARLFN
jgi:hypothetical protein